MPLTLIVYLGMIHLIVCLQMIHLIVCLGMIHFFDKTSTCRFLLFNLRPLFTPLSAATVSFSIVPSDLLL